MRLTWKIFIATWVFIADRHLGFLALHVRIQLVPGGQNALLAMHFAHKAPNRSDTHNAQ
jgi:hypothetical protein